MDTDRIRNSFLEFVSGKGYNLIDQASIVPQGDTSTLFTCSGMQPLISYLLGKQHSSGSLLVNVQGCIRTQDIDEVGDNRHITFFEMLGNWTLGVCDKTTQIKLMFEWFSEHIKLDMSRLYVTCFNGSPEHGIPKDTESGTIWKNLFNSIGIDCEEAVIGSEDNGYVRGIRDNERIFYYDSSKNWWSRDGKPENTLIGDPCGGDSEMFYDFGTPHDSKYGNHCHPNCDCGRFVEIGNNVFMTHVKTIDGCFRLLEKPNIDHGSGLERIACAISNEPDVYKVGLLRIIIEKIELLTGKSYTEYTKQMRIIADHFRTSFVIASSGIEPSNREHGYVLRRLIRRSVTAGLKLGITNNLFYNLSTSLNIGKISSLLSEENVFRNLLPKATRHLNKLCKEGTVITGTVIFKLHETNGIPIEITLKHIEENNLQLSKHWKDEFKAGVDSHRNKSKR